MVNMENDQNSPVLLTTSHQDQDLHNMETFHDYKENTLCSDNEFYYDIKNTGLKQEPPLQTPELINKSSTM